MLQKKGRERKLGLKLMALVALFGSVCVVLILFGISVNKGIAQKMNLDDALTSPSPSPPGIILGPGGPHIESANIDISGTVWTDELKGSNIGAGVNISLAVNGGVKTTVATVGAGTFTFSTITVTAGQPFVIFIDNADTNHGNLVSRAKETNITGLDMYTNDIVLRHEDAGPLSNANLATADNTDAEIKYAVAGGVNVTYEAGYKVWVESAMTYTPGGTIDGESLEIRTTGTMNSASNNITLTGTWKVSSTGTLTISGGTVTFNPSAGTKNIDTGGTDGNHDFNNVTKSGAGTIKLYNGTSTSTSFSMKMGGTLTVSTGTFDTNGRNLTMGVYSQTGGTFDADAANSGNNENTITCLGAFTINASLTYNARQSNLILDATAGDITFTGGGYTFNDVTFQNNSTANARTITPTSGTYTLNGSLFGEANYMQNVTLAANTNNPSFTITGGIIYQGEAGSAGNESISMGTGSWTVQSGNIYLTDGTITAGSSTLTSNSSGWQELGEGTDSKVYALTSWTNGGTTYLVAGGTFKEIGSGTTARRLAAWNGTSWAEVGGGVNMAVRALSVWSNGGTDYLAVAGNFTKVNDGATSANRIALWDGANWTALGTGLNGIGRALTVYNTNLVVGGNFTTAGGGAANYIAQWDGANWTTFGTGMSSGLYALTTWTYSATTYLVAGGEFVTAGGVTVNNIAKWNGAAWSAFAGGMDDVTYHTVYALTVYGSNLVAGGDFIQVNGDTSIKRVAQWSGVAWSAFGSGFGGIVSTLLVSGGNLYAGGWYRASGGVPMKRITKWNSGGGVWELVGEIGANKPVLSLTEWTYASVTYIIMGGNFYKVDGQLTRKIAKWDGSSWSGIGDGIEDPVRSLATYGGNLYLGGSFSDAGGVDADGIASWNGTSYADVGGGVNGTVYTMVAWSNGGTDYLAVGGSFTTAGSTTVNRIALWDGANWTALGTGMNDTVYALNVWGGNLIAGGKFTTAGGGAANRLASWNGAAWSQVGGGVDDNSVRSLAVLGANLEVGGNFTAVNTGTAMSRIGEWTGAAWNALGTGAASGYVYALTVSGTDLYAGGSFSGMGGVANTKYIAKWDGANWTAVGTGMDGGYVYSLSIFDSKLEAGGDFTTAGGVVARRAAEYGGGAWSPLGSGMDDNVYTLATYNSELYAGGLFATASGTLINRIAKWGTQKITTAAQSFNNVTFSASSTSNRKSMISGAFTMVGNLSISESSSGILTLDLDTYDPAMNLTGTFAMGSGTAFLGGSSAITTSNTVSINGGAFTSTSNTFTVNNTFTRAAGATFTHNSGTFLFYANAAYTITANGCTFNNVTFDKTATTARIITFANGFTAAGNLQVSNNATSPNTLSFYGTSNPTITVNGNVTFPATAATGVLVWGDTTNNFSMAIQGNLLVQDGITYYTNTTMNSTTADQGITISAGTVSTGSWTINDTGHIVTLYTNVTTTGVATHLALTDGTLALSTFTFSIGGNYSQTGGTFNGALGGLTLGSTGTFALSVGTFNSPANLSVPGTFTLTSGTFVAPTGTLTINNTFTQVAATFTHSSGMVLFNAINSYNITTNGMSFNNVNFDRLSSDATSKTLTIYQSPTILGNLQAQNSRGASNTFTVNGNTTPTITVNGNVTFPDTGTAGVLSWGGSSNNFSLAIKGNLLLQDSSVTYSTNTTMNSTIANQGITVSAGTVDTGSWTISDTGQIVTLYTNVTTTGAATHLTVTDGTLALSTFTFSIGGNYSQTGGTFNGASGVLTLTAGTFALSVGTFNSPANFSVPGTFTLTSGTFVAPTGTLSIYNTFLRQVAATFTNSSGTVKFFGDTNSYNITTNNCTFKNVTFDKTQMISRTLTLMDTNLTIDGDLSVSNNWTATFTIQGSGGVYPTITVNGNATFPSTPGFAGSLLWALSGTNMFTMIVKGDLSLSDGGLTYYPNTTLNSTAHHQALTIANSPAIGQGNWVIDDSGYTVTQTGNLTSTGAGNFTLTSGGFNMQNNNISFVGNFLQTTGTFTHGNGTITIGGSFTMNNGTFSGGAGNITTGDHSTVAINAGSFTSTSGTFLLKGAFTRAGGATFSHHSGTFKFYNWGSSSYNITTNNCTFNNVIFGKDTGSNATAAVLQDSFTVAGNFTAQNEGSSNGYTLRSTGSLSPTIIVTGSLSFPSTAANAAMTVGSTTGSENFNITLKGDLTTSDANAALYTNLTLDNQLTDQNITTTTYGSIGNGDWVIDKASNTAIWGASLSFYTSGSGKLTLTSGIINLQSYTLSIYGDYTQTTGTFNGASGGFGWTSTSTPALTVNNGTFNSPANMTVKGALTVNNGTFNSCSGTLTQQRNVSLAASTFNHNSGTVSFDTSSVSQTITTNNNTFNNLNFIRELAFTDYSIQLADSFTANGNVSVHNDQGYALYVKSTGGAVHPTLTINGNLTFPFTGINNIMAFGDGTNYFYVTLKGNLTMSETKAILQTAVSFNNTTADQSITISAGTTTGTWTIDKGNYVVSQTTAVTITNLTLTSGTFYTGGNNLTVATTFSNDGTFRLQGGEATLSFTRDTNSGTVEYVGSGATGYASLLYGNTYWNLAINSTSGTNVWTLGAALDVNGPNGVDISRGTLATGGFNITDAGAWNKGASGTFTHGSALVTLDGAATQTVTGGTSAFNNLTTTNASAAGITFSGNCTVSGTFTDTTNNSKLTFGAGSTYTFAAITISATAGNTVTMVSSSPGSHWNFNVSAPTAVTRVAVQDSDASGVGGNTITDIPGTNNGNNHNWIFAMDISGTVYINEGKTLNIGINKTIALSVNGAPKTTVETGAGGTFSFTTISYAENNTVTLFIDGEAEKGNLISQAGAGNIAGLEMVTNKIILRHESAGPMTNALLVTAKTAGETDILYTLSGSDVTFNNNYEVWIDSGKTYTPGALVTADDFYITGTGVFNPAANAVTLHGSYRSATGATLTSSNLTTFDAAGGTETIDSGGTGANHDFLNITKPGGGTLALTGHAIDITGTLTISASNTFNMSSQEMTLLTLDNSGALKLTGSQTATTITNMDTNSGSVEYTGDGTYTSLGLGNNYFELKINSAGGTGSFAPAAGTVDVNGPFTLSSGTFTLATNNPAVHIAGNVTLNAGAYTKGSAMTTFDGDLIYDDNIGAVNIGALTIGHSPNTTTLASDLVCDSLTIDVGDVLITAGYDIDCGGTIDINGTLNAANGVGGNSQINLTGNWDATGGAFTNTNSTVIFDGAAAQSITMAGEDFNNWETTNTSVAGVTFADDTDFVAFTDNAAGSKITFNYGSTYAVLTTLDIDGAAGVGNKVTLVSSSPTNQWFFNVSQLNPTVTYVDVTDSDANGGQTINAISNCTNGGNNENWDFGQPVINSMTFTNKYSGTAHTAVADNTTSWNFEVKVTDSTGATDINYVEIRFANDDDPYNSLKLRFTEGAVTMFTKEADTQSAATLTSVNGDASAVGNQWTLNFKMQLNNSFHLQDTDYNIEVYAVDDQIPALSDVKDYSNAYRVTALTLTFSVDSGSLNLGAINPGIPITGTTVCTVSTNSPNGYDLGIQDNTAAPNSSLLHTDLATYIADYLGTILTPTVWSGTGLGISVYFATNKEAKWGGGASEADPLNRYAGIPQGIDTIHTKIGNPTVNDVTRVGYKLDVPNDQKIGIYTGNVVYTATEKLL